jgi:hypothetical protein
MLLTYLLIKIIQIFFVLTICFKIFDGHSENSLKKVKLIIGELTDKNFGLDDETVSVMGYLKKKNNLKNVFSFLGIITTPFSKNYNIVFFKFLNSLRNCFQKSTFFIMVQPLSNLILI